MLTPTHKSKKGSVQWYENLSDSELKALKQAAQSPEFAVVTLETDKEYVKKLLETPLVFTSKEIKGLEYETILMYKPFEDPAFVEINKLLNGTGSTQSKNNTHRAKKGQGHEQYGPKFNEVYTAITRARKRLIVVQQAKRTLQNIVTPLKESITATQKPPQAPIEVVSEIINTDKWFSEAKMQLERGNEDQARDIFIGKLNKTSAEFDRFKKEFLQTTTSNTKQAIEKLVEKEIENNQIIESNTKQIQADISTDLYIADLISQPTLSKFIDLLNDKNADELLFKYPIKFDYCLFIKLLINNVTKKLFIKALCAVRF